MGRFTLKLSFAALLCGAGALIPASKALAAGPPRPVAQDSAEIPEVDMDQYMLASARQTRAIETFGASTCVILSLFDATTQIGALAHISAGIDLERSLTLIFRDFKRLGIPSQRLTARLVGGWEQWSEGMVYGLNNRLAREGVQILERDVLAVAASRSGELLPGRGKTVQNVILDLNSGRLFDYEENAPWRLRLSRPQQARDDRNLSPVRGSL